LETSQMIYAMAYDGANIRALYALRVTGYGLRVTGYGLVSAQESYHLPKAPR